MKKLLDLKFQYIGQWSLVENGLGCKLNDDEILNISNVLYAFVKRHENSESIVYIGKTTQTIPSRFYGYIRGNGKSTNYRIHNSIKESLENGDEVQIWALFDDAPLSWGEFNINLAAALEDSLIKKLNPIWNGSKTAAQELEEVILEVDNSTLYPIEESINLNSTYYNKGFVNVSTANSPYLAEHNAPIHVFLGDSKFAIESKINRTANINGSVRLTRNIAPIANYYQEKYSLGDQVRLQILSRDKIKIL